MPEETGSALRHTEKPIAEGDKQPSDRKQRDANPSAAAIPVPQTPTNQRDSEKPNNGTLRDPMFWLLLGTLIATSAAACFTYQQADTAKKALFAEQRAWIDAPKISYEKVGDQILFKYAFKNFGHSPTRGLHIDGRFIPSAKAESDWHAQVDDYCSRGRRIVIDKLSGYSSAAIIPEASYSGPFAPGLQGGTTKEITDNPVLVGCASYGQSLDGTAVDTTGFHAIIRLSEMPPGSVIPVEAIDPD